MTKITEQLKAGDIINQITGPGVTWPWNAMRFKVIAVLDGEVKLEPVGADKVQG